MADPRILNLVADIVSAHVSNNAIAAQDVPKLIDKVYAAIAALGRDVTAEAEVLKPAVSVRTSVKPDSLICLECGGKFRTLKRHLDRLHGLTVADYRNRWQLPASYPMLAPDYAARRKNIALKAGLGRKPKNATQEPVKVAKGRKKLSLSFD